MVANYISYHLPCMNSFKATRVSTCISTPKSLHAVALNHLVEQLEVSLFQEKSGFLVKSLRDQYRNILQELGVKTAQSYRSITLKRKLQKKFGERISIINQTGDLLSSVHHSYPSVMHLRS